MKYLFLFPIVLMSLLSCNRDDEPTYHDVELRVTSTGTFKVWYNYSRNPEANENYLTQPPKEYNKTFSKKISLKEGDFYELKVTPTTVPNTSSNYFYTAQVFVNGNLIEEKYSNGYTNLENGHFNP